MSNTVLVQNQDLLTITVQSEYSYILTNNRSYKSL
jgi:hypothetical protein